MPTEPPNLGQILSLAQLLFEYEIETYHQTAPDYARECKQAVSRLKQIRAGQYFPAKTAKAGGGDLWKTMTRRKR